VCVDSELQTAAQAPTGLTGLSTAVSRSPADGQAVHRGGLGQFGGAGHARLPQIQGATRQYAVAAPLQSASDPELCHRCCCAGIWLASARNVACLVLYRCLPAHRNKQMSLPYIERCGVMVALSLSSASLPHCRCLQSGQRGISSPARAAAWSSQLCSRLPSSARCVFVLQPMLPKVHSVTASLHDDLDSAWHSACPVSDQNQCALSSMKPP